MTDANLTARSVVVLGAARSGVAAARALMRIGASVTLLDGADDEAIRLRTAPLGGARVLLGRTEPEDVADADLIVASPGVPPSSPWLKAAEAAAIPVWSEIELAYRLGSRPVAGITGTNGKTTTTQMLAAVLRAAGRDAVEAGNVGTPLIDTLDAGVVVAEISSQQLHAIEQFRVPVAVLLNIAPDHLDWHGSYLEYKRAKARLFQTQQPGDAAIVHADPECDALVAGGAAHVTRFHEAGRPIGGAGIEDGWIVVPRGRVMPVERLRSGARPFRADAVAAAAAAALIGLPLETIADALAAFVPQPHRIETVAEIGGVTYVNDSKATDPHATLAALEEMRDVVLIAGGRSKGVDLSELAEASWALRAVVAIGEAASEIVDAFEGTDIHVSRAASMDDAVEQARACARPGDTVLLSPACSSWDMFVDYAERGEAFCTAVRRLEGSAG